LHKNVFFVLVRVLKPAVAGLVIVIDCPPILGPPGRPPAACDKWTGPGLRVFDFDPDPDFDLDSLRAQADPTVHHGSKASPRIFEDNKGTGLKAGSSFTAKRRRTQSTPTECKDTHDPGPAVAG